MKSKNKTYLIVGAIVVILGLLLSIFVNVIVSLIIALIIAVVAYLIIDKYITDKDTVEINSDIEEMHKSEDELGIESLLSINLELRKSIIPIKVRDDFEQVIDQLLDILPKINQASPDSELAWVINRMATEYLPEKSIKPFLALDENVRNDESTIASVEEGLSGMKAELLEVENIIASRNTNEFNSKAKFLKHRFNV